MTDEATMRRRLREYAGRVYGYRPFSGPRRPHWWLLAFLALVVLPMPWEQKWPTVAIVAVGLGLREARSYRWWRTMRVTLQRLADEGVFVRTALVQANEVLFRPGRQVAPCLVLLTFDREAEANGPYMLGLAARLGQLKGIPQADRDLAYASQLVTDERAVAYRRRQLPLSFTGGPVVYAADLVVRRDRLRGGYIQERFLPCVAAPGEKGALQLVPYWITEGGVMP